MYKNQASYAIELLKRPQNSLTIIIIQHKTFMSTFKRLTIVSPHNVTTAEHENCLDNDDHMSWRRSGILKIVRFAVCFLCFFFNQIIIYTRLLYSSRAHMIRLLQITSKNTYHMDSLLFVCFKCVFFCSFNWLKSWLKNVMTACLIAFDRC